MRIVLVVFSCVLVAAVVAITVFKPTAPVTSTVEAPRIALAEQPRPLAPGGRGSDSILELFPELKDAAVILQDDLFTPPTTMAAEPYVPPSDEINDKARLLSLVNDWIYVNFSQLGQKKNGTIQKTRTSEYFIVFEGQTLETGITVHQVSEDQVTLHMGEAAFALRLAKKPEFFDDVRKNPRALTRDEQVEAYEYYLKRFGDKFKALSQNYEPLPGYQMPTKITAQQQQKAMQDYQEKHGRVFQREQMMYGKTATNSTLDEQKVNFRKYWQQFHPSEPMPDYETYLQANDVGPAKRILSDEDSN
ncbi:MAG: hypothetical protein P9L94_19235 [Candidatus Hinthialibacter antarcticus]|nr:hypothetical protein [Candidatus Hinthialibacter antarcticus]